MILWNFCAVCLNAPIVDSTVQEKAIAYPVDSRLLEIARHKIVVHAKRCGITLRQSFDTYESREFVQKSSRRSYRLNPVVSEVG